MREPVDGDPAALRVSPSVLRELWTKLSDLSVDLSSTTAAATEELYGARYATATSTLAGAVQPNDGHAAMNALRRCGAGWVAEIERTGNEALLLALSLDAAAREYQQVDARVQARHDGMLRRRPL